MNLRNSLVIFLQRLLGPLGFRLVKLTADKVRGVDAISDLAFLLEHKREPVVFDVGANDGETVQDFLRMFPDARIVAFEPYALCCDLLTEKFRDRPHVRVQNVALGAARGQTRLNLYSGNRMNSLLTLDEDASNPMRTSFTPTGTADVRLESLDDFCTEHGFTCIDVLKIDTQGYDLQVLKGAVKLLQARRVRTILLEANFVPMYRRQATFSELHEFLSQFGYRLVDFYNQTRTDGYVAWCDVCYVAASEPLARS